MESKVIVLCRVDMFSARKTIKKSNLKDIFNIISRVVARKRACRAHVASIWQHLSRLVGCRKYWKFSYVLCLAVFSHENETLARAEHYKEIYHRDNTGPPHEPIVLIPTNSSVVLSRYPQCNLAAASFASISPCDRQLPMKCQHKQNKTSQIKLIIFFLSFSSEAFCKRHNCTL